MKLTDNQKLIGILIMVVGALLVAGHVDRPQYDPPKRLDWRESTVAKFFIKKGVTDPVNKAIIIVENSKYLKIASAQAVVESRVEPKAIGKKKEKGAFQVQEKHWGKVADILELQTRQHSDILSDLIEEKGDVKIAIKAYNGSGKKADQYARLVIRNMREVGL